jgi:hypothetical protein
VADEAMTGLERIYRQQRRLADLAALLEKRRPQLAEGEVVERALMAAHQDPERGAIPALVADHQRFVGDVASFVAQGGPPSWAGGQFAHIPRHPRTSVENRR